MKEHSGAVSERLQTVLEGHKVTPIFALELSELQSER